MWRIFAILALATSLASGQGAQAVLRKSDQLELTDSQKDQIRAIQRETVQEYNQLSSRERGRPGLSQKLSDLRKQAQDEALQLLTSSQRQVWNRLAGPERAPTSSSPSEARPGGDGSLLIPSIDELKNPPFPGAFGPSTGLAKMEPHEVPSQGYLILTDHTDPIARDALDQLAQHREGKVISLESLGELHESPSDLQALQETVRKAGPRYVAIAPKNESYRENMHLSMLKLLSGIDDDPELDAFPGYLMASDAEGLAELVQRTIQFRPLAATEIEPVSIGAIEDADARRYRSYQKAKVMQKMFAEQGRKSPAIITTTRKSHTEREDFPELPTSEGNIVMLPSSERHTFDRLSLPAEKALEKNNLLFLYGHGTTSRICGIDIDAFASIDFTNELVFCGSCMSATPYEADRVNLESKRDDKRFAFYAMDNGAVMMLGHMGLCGGFPKVFPMAELVLSGTSTGEAYQQLMNSLIGGRPIPEYYSGPPASRDPRNGYLYVLWGDPALIPIAD